MSRSDDRRHLMALWAALAVTVLWSSSWVLIRVGLDDEDLEPLTFAGLRYLLAALVLVVVPAISLVLYGLIGDPGAPDMPFAERADQPAPAMPGEVDEVSDRGAVIANDGVMIEGLWGAGGEVHGILSFSEMGPGFLHVKESATRDDLESAQANSAAGLVCGGLHLQDFRDLRPEQYTEIGRCMK